MRFRRIYVASSWRNQEQPRVVRALRAAGHGVYDFRNDGFSWSTIDTSWESWSLSQFVEALFHPLAVDGFGKDYYAMEWADTFVLVMPCGRSAHLEAGWAIGQGKPTFILIRDGEPELMYKLADGLVSSIDELTDAVADLETEPATGSKEESMPGA